MDEDRYEQEDGARVLAILSQVPERVKRQWEPQFEVPAFTRQNFYHQPTLDDLREGRDLELRFPAPVNLTISAELGKVVISWELDERGTVDVIGFNIYRTGPEGGERRVAQAGDEATSWTDTSIQAGKLYSYRVTCKTDEEALARRGAAESKKSRAVSVRGKKDYEIQPKGLDAANGVMRVLVRKHTAGIWHEKEFDAKKGEPIGIKDPGSGVDYGTGCQVKSFDVRRETVKETRDEVQFDEKARVIVKGGEPVTRRVTYDRPVEVVVLNFRNEVGETERTEFRRKL